MKCHVLLSALIACISMQQAYGQVCTDFGRAIEGAAVDKQGSFYAVNGELQLCHAHQHSL
jgi:hypothetical protein